MIQLEKLIAEKKVKHSTGYTYFMPNELTNFIK
jgi:hypothetical protein